MPATRTDPVQLRASLKNGLLVAQATRLFRTATRRTVRERQFEPIDTAFSLRCARQFRSAGRRRGRVARATHFKIGPKTPAAMSSLQLRGNFAKSRPRSAPLRPRTGALREPHAAVYVSVARKRVQQGVHSQISAQNAGRIWQGTESAEALVHRRLRA